MEKHLNIPNPINGKDSQDQANLSLDDPFYPETEDAYSTEDNESSKEEDKIVHNGEGIDPDAWNERADFNEDDWDELDNADEEGNPNNLEED